MAGDNPLHSSAAPAPDVFEDRLRGCISAHSLLSAERPVIVAVSGGADSVALLAALSAIGYECVAAHCNFHLRGDESNRDMRFVRDLCQQMGIDLYVRDFNVGERCSSTGESLEMACRSLRYEWFGNLLDKVRAQAIAVAHHREDNVETFFLNLMRGSGLAGLTGMRWRNGYIVRPLLDFSRADIEAYLQARGIGYVVDSTNAECDFSRNRLRNVVLPAFYEAFPGAEEGILKSIAILGDNRELYQQTVAEKSQLYLSGTVLHLQELITEQPMARLLLFEMIRGWGFNMSQVDDILASAGKSGLSFSAGKTTLELDRGRLLVTGRTCYEADEVEVNLRRDVLSPVAIEVSEHPVAAFHPTRNPQVAYFDVSILDGNPKFTLRRWRRGDRITPFGMRGSRLLSDIFSDAKLSASDKRNVWLLTRDSEIIWVLGLRTTTLFSVGPETRRFLTLRTKNNGE